MHTCDRMPALASPAMPALAALSVVALDCREPRRVADFYSALTGAAVERDDGGWVQLVATGGVALAFQLAPDHEAPEWPSAERPQQLHLDFDVPDLDAGERSVLSIGARKASTQPAPDSFRVFLDPAGHPFCLVLA